MAKLTMLKPRVATLDTSIARPPPKVVEPFYTSKPWLDLMASIKRQRGERCQDCGRTGTRIFGDHVVELKDGGERLDPGNILLRCGSCHSRKTAKARSDRHAGR